MRENCECAGCLKEQLAQAQASLAAAQQLALCPLHQQYKRFCAICATELEAAARAQALEPIRDHFRQWANDLEKEGKYEAAQYIRATEVFVSAELSVTPSEPALAKLLAEERLAELNLIPQSDYWNTGLEGYIMRRKDTLTARVAELKGRKDSV